MTNPCLYDLSLFADNTSELYFSREVPILKNLMRKAAAGKYDAAKAAKLWGYWAKDAAARYCAAFPNCFKTGIFSKADLEELARNKELVMRDAIFAGNAC